ncbi:MAG: NUDIX hydrolase [Alphaproteobacteria bacterium]|nr:NUDIX hydrolase [Alphaproteobacteria bacterium]MBL7096624.1 NUDIX hydrolase [Alphaproteobacteria bacterium]
MPETAKPAAVPVPAATIMLLRDGADGLEVFMVKRHHQIDFVAGALVFPGGKLEKGDSDAALERYFDGGSDWTPEMRALGAAAIREAFEESGILLARDATTGDFVSAERLERLQHYRPKLDKREVSLDDMLEKEKLRLALDQLVHFAHWITPANMPKRFDTHFFLAVSPIGHSGSHDGRESVDSVWTTAHAAMADRKRWSIIFPTRLNLVKLGKSNTVAGALAAAKASKVLPVLPWIENGPDGQVLRIRDDAGYEQTSESMRGAG